MENTENKTIADVALENNESAQPKVQPKAAEEKAVEKKVPNKKYLAGMYRSDKFMRIIKELTYTHTKDENGKVQKTHGTWAKPQNMIIFQKGVETRLTEADVELPAIQRLIDSKAIYRMG